MWKTIRFFEEKNSAAPRAADQPSLPPPPPPLLLKYRDMVVIGGKQGNEAVQRSDKTFGYPSELLDDPLQKAAPNNAIPGKEHLASCHGGIATINGLNHGEVNEPCAWMDWQALRRKQCQLVGLKEEVEEFLLRIDSAFSSYKGKEVIPTIFSSQSHADLGPGPQLGEVGPSFPPNPPSP